MFCEKCGLKLQDGVRFCKNCGYQISVPVEKKPEKPAQAIKPAVQETKPTPKVVSVSPVISPLSQHRESKIIYIIPLLIVALGLVLRIFRTINNSLDAGYYETPLAVFMRQMVSHLSDVAIIAILPVIFWNRGCAKGKKSAFICIAILAIAMLCHQLLAAILYHNMYKWDLPEYIQTYINLVPGSNIFYLLGVFKYVKMKAVWELLRVFIYDYTPIISLIVFSFIAAKKAGNRAKLQAIAAVPNVAKPAHGAIGNVQPIEEKAMPVSAQTKVRFCGQCGEELAENDLFCTGCGKKWDR